MNPSLEKLKRESQTEIVRLYGSIEIMDLVNRPYIVYILL